ncbi:MAG: SUMF1/EgtB/PvdO family nonheme iron enzyme [Thermoguttaceae bacterium]|nr:SUMF1/EgtB/PvdO family nonheme iron enzyme [Thermoguttaceae bacterium]
MRRSFLRSFCRSAQYLRLLTVRFFVAVSLLSAFLETPVLSEIPADPAAETNCTPIETSAVSAVRRIGLLVDQPAGAAPELETSIVLEIAERIFGGMVEMLYPSERALSPVEIPLGNASKADGSRAELNEYAALWIHQGEEAPAEGPLYAQAWSRTIAELADSPTPRVVVLTGGAPRLLESAGIAKVDSAPMPVMNDRYQCGLIPVGEPAASPIWDGLTPDRGVFWFTNAVYSAFQKCLIQPMPADAQSGAEAQSGADVQKTEVFTAANVPGGPAHPFYAVRHGNCVFFVLSWNFSQLYDHAASEFRTNLETFLGNLLRWQYTPENLTALVTPRTKRTLYPVEPLRKMMDDFQTRTGKPYPNREQFLARLAPYAAWNETQETERLAAVNALRPNASAVQNTQKMQNEINVPQNADLSKDADSPNAAADASVPVTPGSFNALKREILFAHPELDFDRILFVRRKGQDLDLPHNYNSNCVLALPGSSRSNSALEKSGWENALCELNIRTGEQKTLFVSPRNFWIGDLELHFDAEKVLFSMPSPNMETPRWRIWELPLPKDGAPSGPQAQTRSGTRAEIPSQASEETAAGTSEMSASFAENIAPDWNARPVQIPTVPDADVDDYDACYLPDGGIVFCSTACFTGVPCINGSGHVCNLYRKSADGKISQLTVEQDHDWNPVLLPNGRILYLRWEYSDLPHAFSRILMHANPDGTNQTEYYGSGSYYPNTMFYARPIPNSSKFSAIVSGHHELPRIGDLVIFDPSKGRREADGAVQRIPGAGKPVSPVMLDFPIAQTWPKFTQPFPVSETMFLTACRLDASSPWSIYLVDVFDNMLEIARPERGEDGSVFTFQEPTPIRKTSRPPVHPERTDWSRQDADVFIADIYYGQGLPNVPRGTVKALRLFTYEFAYQGMGAEPHSVGLDGPWDPKRVLGTVPVYEDGSASFRMPANTPVAFQALDAEGRAIQLMRSWTTAMPGESVSCTGCHEEQNSVVPAMPLPIASRRPPVEITPDFQVPPASLTTIDPAQPVTAELLKKQNDGIAQFLRTSGSSFAGGKQNGTSGSVQDGVHGFNFQRHIQPILEKHCVACHSENSAHPQKAEPSFVNGLPVPAMEGGNSYNTQSRFAPSYYNLRRYVRTPTKESQMPVLKPYEFHAESTLLVQILRQGHYGIELSAADWARLNTWIDLNCPYYGSWGESRNYQIAPQVKHQFERRLALRRLYTSAVDPDADDPSEFPVPELKPGQTLKPPHRDILFDRTEPDPQAAELAKSAASAPPAKRVELAEGVTLELCAVPGQDWLMGRFEVTNEQYRLFDPKHHSGWEYADFIHFSPNEAGWLLSRARQPVVRISYADAEAFCRWLTEKTGMKFTLPTADEWRQAAMASETPVDLASVRDFWFGDRNVNYARFENLSDAANQKINPRSWNGRLGALPPWRIADGNVNDRTRVSALVGTYRPNPWGLFDVHGNVSEWVSTPAKDGSRMALGGSWYLPSRFSGIRAERRFTEGQPVFDVGFRVKCEP